VSYLLAIAVMAGSNTVHLIVSQTSAAVAQSGDAGVFGFRQADWDASFTFGEMGSDGYFVYLLNDGGSLYVRFDSEGNTSYVEYQLGTALSPTDTEAFVVSELLPSDAAAAGEFQDIMVGSNVEGRVTVQLYVSNMLIQFLPGYSGTILVAYREDGLNFSLGIG
jgi:hypothetical protein